MTYEVDSDPLWYRVFQELMCQLYKAFGGDCSELDWSAGAAPMSLQTIRNEFEAQGPPTFETQEEADRFLSTLESIEAHLGSPEATIQAELAADVRALIDEIRSAWVS
ncbi:MAG TPA: hypothetical protein VFF69_02060 [Phycisphaerales bacterium]|nr:hypothetical protein [Phycisphaerales bacterium]